jgi:hypothetical protein
MRKRLSDQRGGALLLTLVFMTVLLAMAAFAIDVGAWFRADRSLQATVDAAALAGAQKLPGDPTAAKALALEYSAKNGNPPDPTVLITSTDAPNDTIVVEATVTAEGFFSRVIDVDEVDVAAHAKAKLAKIAKARYAAPIVVSDEHPMLKCAKKNGAAACYGKTMTLTLTQRYEDIPGAFALVTLDGDKNVGSSTLADWLMHGYGGLLSVNRWYTSVPGAKFNDSPFQDGLNKIIEEDRDVLLPVYSTAEGQGSNGRYYIVGWVVMNIDSYATQGNKSTITGTFRGVTWTGEEGGEGENYGVSSIRLVE